MYRPCLYQRAELKPNRKEILVVKKLYNNKGMTLPLVLIVLVFITVLGFAMLNMTSTQARFNTVDETNKKAIEYAEAGYNAYLWHLNDDVNYYSRQESIDMQNIDISFQDGYYKLEVTKPSDIDRFITIKSTGWTKSNPSIKRTIEAKIRKKQFVHHVYVSDNEGSNIWWTTGDESHGPYHTNGDLRIQGRPVFFDTITYNKKKTLYKGTGYNPDFKVTDPVQPQKVDTLDFPASNAALIEWASKDGMLFTGRTCIYIDGENVKIRNKNSSEIITKSISSIKNKVIYVDTVNGSVDKFNINSGNIFISGQLNGVLTIAAANDIFITYDDPTNWYDYDSTRLTDASYIPPSPPMTFKWKDNRSYSYPETGGISYKNTTFTPSYKPTGKNYYIRDASGKDMLGLVANRNILINHYGWPKKAIKTDLSDNNWNFKWVWGDYGQNVRTYLYRDTTYYNIKVNSVFYSSYRPSSSNYYNVWVPDEKWGTSSQTYDGAPKEVMIHSVVFAVNGGFGFEDYDKGAKRGYITLWGNITQRIRLAVGLIESTGYLKKYSHDPRMFYDYPPHILEPTNVGWEIHEWKEINN